MGQGWGTLVLSAGIAMATAVSAQTVAPSVEPDQTDQTATNESISDIVVTGSRLQTTILKSPSPIVAITSQDLERAGTDNLERTLTQLPSIGVGLSDTNSENFYAEAGLNLIDLRHLGYNRTLVLVNGRRQVAGDIYTEAVDLNSIPAPMVERVEVVTGGTSAVYGADAVSGVVNILLKDHYEGLDVRARGGLTAYGDGGQDGVSFLAGQNFDSGRGNVTASFVYDNTEGVNALSRPWGRDVTSVIPNPNGSSPQFVTVQDARFFGINQLGFIGPIGNNGYYTPINNGTAVRPYDGGPLGVAADGVQVGGDGGYFRPYDNLSLPLERFVGAINASYQLFPDVELFAEGRWAQSYTSTRWQPAADFQYGEFPISASNPFVPSNLRTLLAQAGQDSVYFGREYDAFGRRGANDDRLTQQYTGGLRGEVFDRFKYEVFAGYGETGLRSDLVGGRDQTRFLQSVDVISLNGVPACADPAARAAGCQPFNPFFPQATPAGTAYSAQTDVYKARQDLITVGANISGDLFTLPAPSDTITGSLGVEFRRNDSQTFPSILAQQGDVQLFFEQPEKGHIDVKEVFGEVRVPILKDLPAIDELTFQGAARYSDYNTNGGHVSWNAGGIYAPVESITFRVMHSRSVRAPNVDELYSTESQTFENLDDPCSSDNLNLNPNRARNCAALGIPASFEATTSSKAAYFGGNPKLDVETADTLTVGMTVAPHYVPGLSLTIDYFDINLAKAIGSLDPQTILDTCVDLPGGPGSNPDCSAITRDPVTHQITGVFSNNQNFGRVYTRGIDFNVTYDVPLQGIWAEIPGRLVFNATGTYLDKLRQFDNASDPSTEHKYEGYLGLPKWMVLGTTTYAIDNFAVTLRTRLIDSTSILGSDLAQLPLPNNVYSKQTTGVKVYNDLSLSYDVDERTNLRLNVDNLFNTTPPKRPFDIDEGISYGSSYGAASIYPNLGTVFSFVLQRKFL